MPSRPGADSSLDIGVVTLQGLARLNNGLQLANSEWFSDEVASLTILRTQCPLEAWATWEESWYPLIWCGFEMGWGDAFGTVGKEPQPGFAVDQAGYTPYSLAPPPGVFLNWTLQDGPLPKSPERFRTVNASTEFYLETPRDFVRDMARIDDQLQRIADTYSWYDDVIAAYPIAQFFDDQACPIGTSELSDFDTDTLRTEETIEGASSVWLGLTVEEDYDGEVYRSDGYLSTAYLSEQNGAWKGETTGPTLWYDDYNGKFAGEGAAGLLGLEDIPSDESFEIAMVVDDLSVLGIVDGPNAFALTSPDVLFGDVVISQREAFELKWNGIQTSEYPDRLIVELRVYDYETATEKGALELARLVTSADPQSGELTFPAEEISRLPTAYNEVDIDDNFIGNWAELNLVLHQPRKIPYRSGDLVVNFATVITAPVLITAE